MKKFSIYCSGNASRVIKFYSDEKNRLNFHPEGIFYDGQNKEVVDILYSYFPGRIKFLDHTQLTNNELKRIHTTTSNEIFAFIKNNDSEYLICFGDKILKKELIDSYTNKIINFHPSLLPSFRGLKAIDQAIEAQVDFLGNTAHFIDEGVDTGRIIVQSVMLRDEFEDYEDVLELQFPLLKMILRDILGYYINDDELVQEISSRSKSYLIKNRIIL